MQDVNLKFETVKALRLHSGFQLLNVAICAK